VILAKVKVITPQAPVSPFWLCRLRPSGEETSFCQITWAPPISSALFLGLFVCLHLPLTWHLSYCWEFRLGSREKSGCDLVLPMNTWASKNWAEGILFKKNVSSGWSRSRRPMSKHHSKTCLAMSNGRDCRMMTLGENRGGIAASHWNSRVNLASD